MPKNKKSLELGCGLSNLWLFSSSLDSWCSPPSLMSLNIKILKSNPIRKFSSLGLSRWRLEYINHRLVSKLTILNCLYYLNNACFYLPHYIWSYSYLISLRLIPIRCAFILLWPDRPYRYCDSAAGAPTGLFDFFDLIIFIMRHLPWMLLSDHIGVHDRGVWVFHHLCVLLVLEESVAIGVRWVLLVL